MSHPSSTWKQAEREVAKRLGCQRHGPVGTAETSDLSNDWLVVEVKHRKTLPLWLLGAVAQASYAARDTGKLPIAVLHEAGSQYDDSLVVLRLSEFLAWFGDTQG